MRICITGGSGFIGSELAQLFVQEGHSVLILDQRPPKMKTPHVVFKKTNLVDDIPVKEYVSCDAVIHLAGANIFGRWTREYKKLILESRVTTAKALIEAVEKSESGPAVFVSASATGYYGDGGETELTELAPNGNDFLANVCHEWENIAKTAEIIGMRWVSIRTGIVLGKGGGMLAKLLPLFKRGLGGRLGSGTQWFSWIHIDDLLRVYKAVVLDTSLSGPINAVSPHPVRNHELTKTLGKVLRRPVPFVVPRFALRLILGELGTAILMSQKVMPQKLIDKKFSFAYPRIQEALQKCL